MKFSISQAARHVGLSRKAFYDHIKSKGITVERDEKGKQPKIDASELLRVYGDQFRMNMDTPKETGQGTDKYTAGNTRTSEANVQIAVLDERLKNLEVQRDQFKELFEQEKQERQQGQRLLTDERDKQNKWEKSFNELRQQVLEREEGIRKELNELKEEKEKQIRRYRKALVQERNKTLWEKLFTKRIERKRSA